MGTTRVLRNQKNLDRSRRTVFQNVQIALRKASVEGKSYLGRIYRASGLKES